MIELKPLIYIFSGCTIIVTVYILVYKTFKSIAKRREDKWKKICDEVICELVFNEEFDSFVLPKKVENLLNIKSFQFIMTQKILFSCNNFSGQSLRNLQKLYLFLQLDKYALYLLKSRSWHIKAKAIQEIGIIKLKKVKNEILKETNNKNEFVRAEAQVCLIKLIGYEGLNFLNTIKYPISEWHQITLLREVSRIDHKSFNNIDTWLQSKNDSVVMFGLKLVKTYHLFQLYPNTIACLSYKNSKLRNESIKTLTSIHNNTTANLLTEYFLEENIKNQIEILNSLQEIGTEAQIPFLLELLTNPNKDILKNTVTTITSISEHGIKQIKEHQNSHKEPLKSIVSLI